MALPAASRIYFSSDSLYPTFSVRRLISKYILVEILVPFFFSLILFSFVLFLARMPKIIEPLINYGVPLSFVMKIVLLMLPSFLEVAMPIALLMGGLLAFGRLAEDGELLALKCSGLTQSRLSVPMWVVSGAVFCLTEVLLLYASPEAHRALKETLSSVSKTTLGFALKEKAFFDRIPNLVLYVDEIPPPGGTLKGVVVSDNREQLHPSVVMAKAALLLGSGSDMTFRLIDGAVYSEEPKGKGFQRTGFSVYDLNVSLAPALGSQEKQRKPDELGLKALMSEIAKKRAGGQSARDERVELNRRFALPFSCLIFAAASILYGLCNFKHTRPKAAVTGLVVIALYYIFYAVGQSVASKGFVPAFVGAWLPNIVVGAIELASWMGPNFSKR